MRPFLSSRLLLRFGIVSGLAMVLLGAVLVVQLRADIRGQAIQQGRTLAVLTTRLRVAPLLRPDDLRRPLDPARTAQVKRELRASLDDTHVVRMKLWSPHGLVVFSDDPALQGRRLPVEDDLRDALTGHVHADVSHLDDAENADDRRFGELIEVYVPLRFAGVARPAGAFEVYVPYATVAAQISASVRRMVILLLGGLALLWAALFRLVAGASRRLHRAAEANYRLAHEDGLTGLANRTSFLQGVEAALEQSSCSAAVLLLDLDRFKDLNDSLGHHAGDLLLREIGPRLTATLPAGTLIARLGGDEFAAFLHPLGGPAEAQAAAAAVRRALADPVQVAGIAVSAEASIGIAVHPQDGDGAAELLQRADVAMYTAKAGRAGVARYRPGTDRGSHERLVVLSELREAIERDELVLHYQPKVALEDGRTVGAEALVRWNHPRRGLLGPQHFVGLAEHTGLIGDLTRWVLARAMRDARDWQDAGVDIGVAVNLSVANLVDPDLPGLVARLLAETRLPPRAVELEITESVLMTEPSAALVTLSLLRSMGVGLAVDDYGTGHSSLAYLHRLPLDTLKIDRSFVASIAGEGGVIVRSTVDLAHNLGLRVVAEGIEDPGTAAQLRALGCDLGQGFHYARPVPVAELLDRLTGGPGFVADVRPDASSAGAAPVAAPYPARSA